VALVHNGIIENFKPLRDATDRARPRFESETDTEVVAHLVSEQVEAGKIARARRSRPCCPSCAAPSRSPSPSAAPRFADRRAARLAAGRRLWRGRDLSRLRRAGARAAHPAISLSGGRRLGRHHPRRRADFRQGQQPVTREITASGASAAAIEKGNYRHFMQKEIFEQPTVVAQTLSSYIRPLEQTVALPQMDFDLAKASSASPSLPAAPASMPGWSPNTGSNSSPACRSTSMWRASSAIAIRCWSRRPRAVHLASGRNRRYARRAAPLQGQWGRPSPSSSTCRPASMAREADLLLPTHAGPEIGVASTKAFTCQLAVLAALAAHLAVKRGQ
jgi:glucosamine--fructose-6-phosphate aminotransferase (isomerizing)